MRVVLLRHIAILRLQGALVEGCNSPFTIDREVQFNPEQLHQIALRALIVQVHLDRLHHVLIPEGTTNFAS